VSRIDLSQRRDEHFDAEYYRRYYHQADTAVVTPAMQRNEVAFVIAFCRHIELQISRFSDVGAGTGWWAREFARRYPECTFIETFDASEAACRLYGHRHGELQTLAGHESDLVVCRDVLRYLSDTEAEKGIRRLARKCRGVLYLHVITRDDEIDEDGSDMAGFFRSTAWYRKRLRAAGFTDCGMGLFVSKKMKGFQPFSIEAR
jgi:SAM-dependent methyltransferase